MNTGIRLFALLLAFGASSASAAKDAKTDPEPVYDPATVVDVKVTVIGIREAPMTEPLDGLHLTVKTDTEAFDIYVGPTDFVKIFGITFAKGDKVQVVGSKVKFDGVDLVLARQVSRRETTFILRDKNGEPFWKHSSKAPQGQPTGGGLVHKPGIGTPLAYC